MTARRRRLIDRMRAAGARRMTWEAWVRKNDWGGTAYDAPRITGRVAHPLPPVDMGERPRPRHRREDS